MGLIILLPPSEGKSDAPGSAASFAQACPEFAREASAIVKKLRGLKTKTARMKAYGVSTAEKADAAHALNLAALDAPGLPAITRYTGVVYDNIDFPTLKDPAHALAHVYIVSALYGLIPASAPIANYKLPMTAALATHWRRTNTARLAAMAQGHTVLSLLPGIHARALAFAPLLTVDFKLAGGKKIRRPLRQGHQRQIRPLPPREKGHHPRHLHQIPRRRLPLRRRKLHPARLRGEWLLRTRFHENSLHLHHPLCKSWRTIVAFRQRKQALHLRSVVFFTTKFRPPDPL